MGRGEEVLVERGEDYAVFQSPLVCDNCQGPIGEVIRVFRAHLDWVFCSWRCSIALADLHAERAGEFKESV